MTIIFNYGVERGEQALERREERSELSTSAEIEKAGNVGSIEEFYIVQTSASFLHL